jgi:hypothetical protein
VGGSQRYAIPSVIESDARPALVCITKLVAVTPVDARHELPGGIP